MASGLLRVVGWENGRHLLVADVANAANFARQVLALYSLGRAVELDSSWRDIASP